MVFFFILFGLSGQVGHLQGGPPDLCRSTAERNMKQLNMLFPLVNGEIVHHHPGPFDGIRLGYNVLRNPIEQSEHFLKAIKRFSDMLPVRVLYGVCTRMQGWIQESMGSV